jgi:hypothetical protein
MIISSKSDLSILNYWHVCFPTYFSTTSKVRFAPLRFTPLRFANLIFKNLEVEGIENYATITPPAPPLKGGVCRMVGEIRKVTGRKTRLEQMDFISHHKAVLTYAKENDIHNMNIHNEDMYSQNQSKNLRAIHINHLSDDFSSIRSQCQEENTFYHHPWF